MSVKVKSLEWWYQEEIDAFVGVGVFGKFATVYVGRDTDEDVDSNKDFWNAIYKSKVLSALEIEPKSLIESLSQEEFNRDKSDDNPNCGSY